MPKRQLPPVASIVRSFPVLGIMRLAATRDGLTSLAPAGADEEDAQDSGITAEDLAGMEMVLRAAEKELQEYLAGKRETFSVPIDMQGTAFQKRVWQELLRIPYGCTLTYGGLAERIGGKHLARAVGQAAGKNNLPIFIPCHRLTGQNEQIGGFSLFCKDVGGPTLKKRLLALEDKTLLSVGS